MKPRNILRSALYDFEKRRQAARFSALPEPDGGWPALLGISFPKSGTHLLDQILLGFSRVAPFSRRLHSFYAEYEGETGRRRPPEAARAWVHALGPRDVGSAHLFADPDVVERVASPAFVPYFIFRDPRDVVVSHVFYVTEMESRHVHHSYYRSLPDFNSRLNVSILGRPELEIEFPSIAGRFSPYAGWLDCPAVLKIHYEDLVTDRESSLKAILDRFLSRVPLNVPRTAMLAALQSAIDPRRSPTFRSGRTGEWRRHFTPEHVHLFKSVAGDMLTKLGYENSSNW